MFRLLVVLAFFIALEIYSFQLIRTLSRGHWWKWIYLAVSVLAILHVILQFILHPDRTQVADSRDIAVTVVLAFFALKVVFFLFLFGEDIYRSMEGLISSLLRKRDHYCLYFTFHFFIKIINRTAILLAAAVFFCCSMRL